MSSFTHTFDDESVAKIVFIRLDPILRMLLRVVKEYRDCCNSSNSCVVTTSVVVAAAAAAAADNDDDQTKTRKPNNQQNEISMLQSISELVLVVKKIIQSNAFQHQGYQLNSNEISTSLAMLFDYFSLPLLAILRMPPVAGGGGDGDGNDDNDNDNDHNMIGSNDNQRRIRQSAIWKCIQISAETLQVTIEQIYSKSDNNKKGKNDDDIMLSPQMIHKCLTACVTALPSGHQIIAQYKTRHRQQQHYESSKPSLDTGEDCIQSIFSLITSIFHTCFANPSTNSSSNDDDNDNTTSSFLVLDVSLMTRILDSAVAYIEPIMAEDDNKNNNNNNNNIFLWNTELSPRSTIDLKMSALTTIHSMLEIETKRLQLKIWRNVFPGVYAGLYRRILQSLRISFTKELHVAILSVQTMCLLLNKCLQQQQQQQQQHGQPQFESKQQKTNVSIIQDALHDLQKLATSELPVEPIPCENDQTDGYFFRQVNQRVPSTLTILINMLTNAKSTFIRQQAIQLNQVILIETIGCWKSNHDANENKMNDMISTSIESVLILSRDNDETVAILANDVLQKICSNNTMDIVQSVASRILSLVESISSLAQSKRQLELQNTLKLITGYLKLSKSNKKTLKALRSSLTTESSFNLLRREFSVLLDIEFGGFVETKEIRSLVVVMSEDENDNTQTKSTTTRSHNCRFLNKETAHVATIMMNDLGDFLGPKYAAMFIDDTMATLFQASLARTKNVENHVGHGQVAWLHEHIGLVVLLEEIAVGAFSVMYMEQLNEKEKKKRARLLHNVAESILPILTNSVFLDLPTVANEVTPSTNAKPTKKGTELLIDNQEKSKSFVVPAAFRGNACFVDKVLDFIGTLLELIAPEGIPFVTAVLFSILEKTTSRNHHDVQTKAHALLRKITACYNFPTVAHLLNENSNMVIGAMMGRIRIPGGRMLSINNAMNEDVVNISFVADSFFRLLNGSGKNNESLSTISMMSSIEDLMTALVAHFDYASTKMAKFDTAAIQFLGLLDSALQLLMNSYNFTSIHHIKNQAEFESNQSEPWFELLNEYRNDVSAKMSPKDGFAKLTREDDEEIKDAKHTDESNDASLSRDTLFVADIATRCCYLLSHPTLKVQIKSCEVLAKCFEFLGFIASAFSKSSSESNGPTTAVLRLVHSSWHAIIARFKSISSLLSTNGTTTLIVSSNWNNGSPFQQNLAEKRLFLAKIYDLLGVMTECAEDFMASRFREVIWPCLSNTLKFYQGKDQGMRTSRKTNRGQLDSVRNLLDSEKILILSAIQNLNRVFRHRPTGEALTGLIPSAGTLLFPFLESEDEQMSSKSLEAIQNMLRIDNDGLYKSLLERSGQSIPPCPLFVQRGAPKHGEFFGKIYSEKLKTSSIELLEFIYSLPEQRIV